MLLSKRIKKQFNGVQELDGERIAREGGERIAKVEIKVFSGEEKKPI